METAKKKIDWKMVTYFALCFVLSATSYFIHPVTPTLLKSLNMPDYMFGVAFASAMATSFCFSPLVGKLSSIFSSRNVLAVGCVGYAFAQFCFSMAKTELTIILARLLGGSFYVTVQVCTLTYVINMSSGKNRSSNLAIKAAVQSLSSAAGYFIGGLLGEISIKTAFYAQITCMLIGAALVMLVLKKDVRAGAEQQRPRLGELLRTANPFSSFLQCRSFLNTVTIVLFASLVLSGMAGNTFEQSFNYYIRDVFNLGSSYNGTIRAVTGVCGLIVNSTLCVWMMKKTNVRHSIIVVMAAASAIMCTMIFIQNWVPFLVVNILYHTVIATKLPLIQSLVAENADAGNSNLLMGFYNSVNSLGMVFGSLVAGFAYDISVKLPFIIGVSVYLISCVGMGIYTRLFERRAAQAKAE
ncbi:MAG: MFS transporter [Clostridia bacterium]|nr:MFS transporter [Clostridia bacterium]